jgi:hypothetical protein
MQLIYWDYSLGIIGIGIGKGGREQGITEHTVLSNVALVFNKWKLLC